MQYENSPYARSLEERCERQPGVKPLLPILSSEIEDGVLDMYQGIIFYAGHFQIRIIPDDKAGGGAREPAPVEPSYNIDSLVGCR